MRKFQFRFETIERVRKTRENEALRVLGDAQAAHRIAVAQKSQLQNDLAFSLERREKLGSEPITALPFQLETEYIAGTKQRILQADQGIFRAMKGVEKALRAYLYARKQTRMIEILREKDFVEFKKARIKYENNALSDLYVMRARLAEALA